METRSAALDVGRALAILGVVAVHVGDRFPALPAWARTLSAMGQYGVQLFFVISAITIFTTIDVDAKKFSNKKTVAFRFYIKRFFRIAPIYYLAILVYGFLNAIAVSKLNARAPLLDPHDTAAIAANIAFIHAFFPSAINNVVPGGWSIGIEMAFYAIAPGLLYLMPDRKHASLIIAVAFLMCAVAMLVLADGKILDIKNNSFLYFSLPAQIPCFLIGTIAWFKLRAVLAGRNRIGGFSVALAYCLMTLGVAGAFVFGVGGGVAYVLAPVCAATAASGLLILLSTRTAARLRLHWLARFGQYSYGVYIWHFLIVFACGRLVNEILRIQSTNAALLMYPAAVLIVAYLSYLFSRATESQIQERADIIKKAILERISAHEAAPLSSQERL
jgi:peptidoglycan/LPS O-acetylase OafA/YrhL